MMRPSTSTLFLAALGVLAGSVWMSATAGAATVILTDLSNFSGNETLIDFVGAGAVQGDPVSSVSGVTFALSPGGIAPRFSNQDTTNRPFGPQGAEAIDPAAAGAPFPYDDLSIVLPAPVDRLAFVINANASNTVDVTVSLAGVPVAPEISFSTDAAGGFTFIGFETDDLFDELVIEIGDAIGFGFWRFDNLRFEVVPEPGSSLLLGLGLLAFTAPRRR